MQDFKLQLGCLLVIMYIEITYIKAALHEGTQRNKTFNALLAVSPCAVIFDGLTAWMVNRMDMVPGYINRLAHLLFFISMDLVIVLTTKYMCELIWGPRWTRAGKLLFWIPAIISIALIVAGISSLDFIEGKTTWYSMGFSVYVCFGTGILYYGALLALVITRRHFLSKDKILGTLSFVIIVGVILVIQIPYPETLITAIFPTILLLGIYVFYENPFIYKATLHNDDMVNGFATMVESRDNNTGGHIKRTKAYVELILDKMRMDKHYRKKLSVDYMTNVINAAPLHDVGKISTPDSILQKPGKLTPEEYDIMKKHAAAGGDIILSTFKDIDNVEFRQIAYEVARHHHEKYNGAGYPDGLKGEEIPLHARIMAIADVFDAVSQNRCYRSAMPLDTCFSIIEEGKGTDFDPELAQLFLDSREDVIRLIEEHRPPVTGA